MMEAQIKQIIQRTHNVKSFRLKIQGEAKNFKAGQFCSICLGAQGKKYFSISSSPTETGYIEFTKKITGSDFSKKLDSLGPDDKVEIEYPFGAFTLDEVRERVAFISGGIGITPIRSICKYAVDKNLSTDIVLLLANRSVKDIVFKDDFEAMQQKNPNLRIVHVLCEPEEGFKCVPGLVNAQIIRSEVPEYALRKFYLCGPPAMVETMEKMLLDELKLPKENVITENFQGY